MARINRPGDSDPMDLTVCDGDLYFTADNDTDGVEMWRLSLQV